MKKALLVSTFAAARDKNSPWVFIGLVTPAGREVICIPSDSFDKKEKFYMEAYNDALVHVMNKEVKIRGLSYGDSSNLNYIL